MDFECVISGIIHHSLHFQVLGKGTFGKVMLARLKENRQVCELLTYEFKHLAHLPSPTTPSSFSISPIIQIYAIKILKKSMVLEKDELAHTLTENHVLAKCSHPFLTSLHYSFQTADLLCFVLEYVNGGEVCVCASAREHPDDMVLTTLP